MEKKEVARKLSLRALQTSLIAGPAVFIFDKTQTWVSDQDPLSKPAFVWLVPLLAGACYALSALLTFLVVAVNKTGKLSNKSHRVADALTDYAQELADQKRDAAVLKLREGVGYLLHTQGANKQRSQLGQLALTAAIRQQDRLEQVSILIDDLGWAEHMAGEDDLALQNIKRGLEVLDEIPENKRTDETHVLAAKALRHQAIIRSRTDLVESQEVLRQALERVNEISESNARRRDVERAQLLHAEALSICIHLKVLKRGRIKMTEPGDITQAEAALERARGARRMFQARDSLTRYAKALFLEHRILEALDRQIEAHEVKTLLDEAVLKTIWNVEEPTNILGG